MLLGTNRKKKVLIMNSWYIILDKTNLEKINKTKCDYWREPNMKKPYW